MGDLVSKFNYRTALVTGASRGLGLAIARRLRREGLIVWATCRHPANLAPTEGFCPLALDLADPESVSAVIAAIQRETDGSPDIMVNNAGEAVFAAFAQFPEADIAGQLRVLLEQPIRLARAFYPAMVARNRGALVNIASLASTFPIPGLSLYCSAKAGLSGFSQALMVETARSKVQIIDLQPSDYQTGFFSHLRRMPPSLPWEEKAAVRLRQLVEDGPLPKRAAADLYRALLSGKSGTVYTGQFRHTRIATLAHRLLGHRFLRGVVRKYYGLT